MSLHDYDYDLSVFPNLRVNAGELEAKIRQSLGDRISHIDTRTIGETGTVTIYLVEVRTPADSAAILLAIAAHDGAIPDPEEFLVQGTMSGQLTSAIVQVVRIVGVLAVAGAAAWGAGKLLIG